MSDSFLIAILAADPVAVDPLQNLLDPRHCSLIFNSTDEFLNSSCVQTVSLLIVSGIPANSECITDFRRHRSQPLPMIWLPGSSKDIAEFPIFREGPLTDIISIEPDAEMLARSIKHLSNLCELTVQSKELQRVASSTIASNQRFFRYISHELASPLRSAKLLQEAICLLTDLEEIRSNSRVSALALTHVIDTLSNLSEYVRPERRDGRLRRNEFCVREVLSEVVAAYHQQASHKGIDLKLSCMLQSPVTLLGDQNRLRQVFVNLIRNAIKYTENGQIRIEIAGNQDGLSVTVADTGVGMSHDKVTQILSDQDFVPAEEFDGGLGIGLKLSREILEAMGGSLEISSELRVGSTFKVTLPIPHATSDTQVNTAFGA